MQKTLSSSEIDDLLQSQVFGHLGCCADNKPYVVPMAYAYKNDVLYGQTTNGRKIEILRSNPHACLEVSHHNKDGTWRSVLCSGRYEELEHSDLPPDAREALQQLSSRLGNVQHSVGVHIDATLGSNTPTELQDSTPTIFRIVITEKTGRAYHAGA